jgi:hypothetical protein
MKALKDYMNDPRITSDPGLLSGPEEILTIHAIRLKQQDETAGMSFEEKTTFHRNRTDAVFAGLGLPPVQYVNLAGQGRIDKQEPSKIASGK